jgi:hypothetical protein
MHPFRAAVEARDLDALVALLADDVEFRSPVFFKPYHGRNSVRVLLAGVSQVLEDWRCVREIGAPGGPDHALHFHARIGERHVEGADFLHHDETGAIDELMVMVRPLSAATALAEAMKAQLASVPLGQKAS